MHHVKIQPGELQVTLPHSVGQSYCRLAQTSQEKKQLPTLMGGVAKKLQVLWSTTDTVSHFPHFLPTSILLSPVRTIPHTLALNEGRADKIFCPSGDGAQACPGPPQERRTQSHKVLGRVGGGMKGMGSREPLQGLRRFPTKRGASLGIWFPTSGSLTVPRGIWNMPGKAQQLCGKEAGN